MLLSPDGHFRTDCPRQDGQRLATCEDPECVLQSGIGMPHRAIKTNIADSLNVIIQIERRPETRFVSGVVEISGYNPETDRCDLHVVFRR